MHLKFIGHAKIILNGCPYIVISYPIVKLNTHVVNTIKVYTNVRMNALLDYFIKPSFPVSFSINSVFSIQLTVNKNIDD